MKPDPQASIPKEEPMPSLYDRILALSGILAVCGSLIAWAIMTFPN